MHTVVCHVSNVTVVTIKNSQMIINQSILVLSPACMECVSVMCDAYYFFL